MKQTYATIADVAKLAGVSKATVSKYMNQIPYVSQESARRIAQAIEQLHYQPNSIARALSRRTTHLIGLITGAFDNPFSAELSKSIEATAASLGYNMVLMSTNDSDVRGLSAAELLAGRQGFLDGLILANVRADAEELDRIKSICPNVVLAHRYLPQIAADYAIVDSFRGGEMAAKHLLQQGHRKICMVNGPEAVYPFRDRKEGFLYELADAGIAPVESFEGCYTLEDGWTACRRILEKNEATAVFLGSDTLALGALEAARELRVDVPGRFSIMGFDDMRYAALAYVPLTTVDGRMKDIGAQAVQMLVQRIGNREDTFYCHKVLEPSLVVRKSVGPVCV